MAPSSTVLLCLLQATSVYKAALALSPHHDDTRLLSNLAAVSASAGAHAAGVAYAMRALDADPSNVHALVNLAVHYDVSELSLRDRKSNM